MGERFGNLTLDGVKFIKDLKVVELRAELEQRGLSKYGNKKELVQRLSIFEENRQKSTGQHNQETPNQWLENEADLNNDFLREYFKSQKALFQEQVQRKNLIGVSSEPPQESASPSVNKDSSLEIKDASHNHIPGLSSPVTVPVGTAATIVASAPPKKSPGRKKKDAQDSKPKQVISSKSSCDVDTNIISSRPSRTSAQASRALSLASFEDDDDDSEEKESYDLYSFEHKPRKRGQHRSPRGSHLRRLSYISSSDPSFKPSLPVEEKTVNQETPIHSKVPSLKIKLPESVPKSNTSIVTSQKEPITTKMKCIQDEPLKQNLVGKLITQICLSPQNAEVSSSVQEDAPESANKSEPIGDHIDSTSNSSSSSSSANSSETEFHIDTNEEKSDTDNDTRVKVVEPSKLMQAKVSPKILPSDQTSERLKKEELDKGENYSDLKVRTKKPLVKKDTKKITELDTDNANKKTPLRGKSEILTTPRRLKHSQKRKRGAVASSVKSDAIDNSFCIESKLKKDLVNLRLRDESSSAKESSVSPRLHIKELASSTVVSNSLRRSSRISKHEKGFPKEIKKKETRLTCFTSIKSRDQSPSNVQTSSSFDLIPPTNPDFIESLKQQIEMPLHVEKFPSSDKSEVTSTSELTESPEPLKKVKEIPSSFQTSSSSASSYPVVETPILDAHIAVEGHLDTSIISDSQHIDSSKKIAQSVGSLTIPSSLSSTSCLNSKSTTIIDSSSIRTSSSELRSPKKSSYLIENLIDDIEKDKSLEDCPNINSSNLVLKVGSDKIPFSDSDEKLNEKSPDVGDSKTVSYNVKKLSTRSPPDIKEKNICQEDLSYSSTTQKSKISSEDITTIPEASTRVAIHDLENNNNNNSNNNNKEINKSSKLASAKLPYISKEILPSKAGETHFDNEPKHIEDSDVKKSFQDILKEAALAADINDSEEIDNDLFSSSSSQDKLLSKSFESSVLGHLMKSRSSDQIPGLGSVPVFPVKLPQFRDKERRSSLDHLINISEEKGPNKTPLRSPILELDGSALIKEKINLNIDKNEPKKEDIKTNIEEHKVTMPCENSENILQKMEPNRENIPVALSKTGDLLNTKKNGSQIDSILEKALKSESSLSSDFGLKSNMLQMSKKKEKTTTDNKSEVLGTPSSVNTEESESSFKSTNLKLLDKSKMDISMHENLDDSLSTVCNKRIINTLGSQNSQIFEKTEEMESVHKIITIPRISKEDENEEFPIKDSHQKCSDDLPTNSGLRVSVIKTAKANLSSSEAESSSIDSGKQSLLPNTESSEIKDSHIVSLGSVINKLVSVDKVSENVDLNKDKNSNTSSPKCSEAEMVEKKSKIQDNLIKVSIEKDKPESYSKDVNKEFSETESSSDNKINLEEKSDSLQSGNNYDQFEEEDSRVKKEENRKINTKHIKEELYKERLGKNTHDSKDKCLILKSSESVKDELNKESVPLEDKKVVKLDKDQSRPIKTLRKESIKSDEEPEVASNNSIIQNESNKSTRQIQKASLNIDNSEKSIERKLIEKETKKLDIREDKNITINKEIKVSVHEEKDGETKMSFIKEMSSHHNILDKPLTKSKEETEPFSLKKELHCDNKKSKDESKNLIQEQVIIAPDDSKSSMKENISKKSCSSVNIKQENILDSEKSLSDQNLEFTLDQDKKKTSKDSFAYKISDFTVKEKKCKTNDVKVSLSEKDVADSIEKTIKENVMLVDEKTNTTSNQAKKDIVSEKIDDVKVSLREKEVADSSNKTIKENVVLEDEKTNKTSNLAKRESVSEKTDDVKASLPEKDDADTSHKTIKENVVLEDEKTNKTSDLAKRDIVSEKMDDVKVSLQEKDDADTSSKTIKFNVRVDDKTNKTSDLAKRDIVSEKTGDVKISLPEKDVADSSNKTDFIKENVVLVNEKNKIFDLAKKDIKGEMFLEQKQDSLAKKIKNPIDEVHPVREKRDLKISPSHSKRTKIDEVTKMDAEESAIHDVVLSVTKIEQGLDASNERSKYVEKEKYFPQPKDHVTQLEIKDHSTCKKVDSLSVLLNKKFPVMISQKEKLVKDNKTGNDKISSRKMTDESNKTRTDKAVKIEQTPSEHNFKIKSAFEKSRKFELDITHTKDSVISYEMPLMETTKVKEANISPPKKEKDSTSVNINSKSKHLQSKCKENFGIGEKVEKVLIDACRIESMAVCDYDKKDISDQPKIDSSTSLMTSSASQFKKNEGPPLSKKHSDTVTDNSSLITSELKNASKNLLSTCKELVLSFQEKNTIDKHGECVFVSPVNESSSDVAIEKISDIKPSSLLQETKCSKSENKGNLKPVKKFLPVLDQTQEDCREQKRSDSVTITNKSFDSVKLVADKSKEKISTTLVSKALPIQNQTIPISHFSGIKGFSMKDKNINFFKSSKNQKNTTALIGIKSGISYSVSEDGSDIIDKQTKKDLTTEIKEKLVNIQLEKTTESKTSKIIPNTDLSKFLEKRKTGKDMKSQEVRLETFCENKLRKKLLGDLLPESEVQNIDRSLQIRDANDKSLQESKNSSLIINKEVLPLTVPLKCETSKTKSFDVFKASKENSETVKDKSVKNIEILKFDNKPDLCQVKNSHVPETKEGIPSSISKPTPKPNEKNKVIDIINIDSYDTIDHKFSSVDDKECFSLLKSKLESNIAIKSCIPTQSCGIPLSDINLPDEKKDRETHLGESLSQISSSKEISNISNQIKENSDSVKKNRFDIDLSEIKLPSEKKILDKKKVTSPSLISSMKKGKIVMKDLEAKVYPSHDLSSLSGNTLSKDSSKLMSEKGNSSSQEKSFLKGKEFNYAIKVAKINFPLKTKVICEESAPQISNEKAPDNIELGLKELQQVKTILNKTVHDSITSTDSSSKEKLMKDEVKDVSVENLKEFDLSTIPLPPVYPERNEEIVRPPLVPYSDNDSKDDSMDVSLVSKMARSKKTESNSDVPIQKKDDSNGDINEIANVKLSDIKMPAEQATDTPSADKGDSSNRDDLHKGIKTKNILTKNEPTKDTINEANEELLKNGASTDTNASKTGNETSERSSLKDETNKDSSSEKKEADDGKKTEKGSLESEKKDDDRKDKRVDSKDRSEGGSRSLRSSDSSKSSRERTRSSHRRRSRSNSSSPYRKRGRSRSSSSSRSPSRKRPSKSSSSRSRSKRSRSSDRRRSRDRDSRRSRHDSREPKRRDSYRRDSLKSKSDLSRKDSKEEDSSSKKILNEELSKKKLDSKEKKPEAESLNENAAKKPEPKEKVIEIELPEKTATEESIKKEESVAKENKVSENKENEEKIEQESSETKFEEKKMEQLEHQKEKKEKVENDTTKGVQEVNAETLTSPEKTDETPFRSARKVSLSRTKSQDEEKSKPKKKKWGTSAASKSSVDISSSSLKSLVPDVKPLSPSELTLQLESEKESDGISDAEEDERKRTEDKTVRQLVEDSGKENKHGSSDDEEAEEDEMEGSKRGRKSISRKKRSSSPHGERSRRKRDGSGSKRGDSPPSRKRHSRISSDQSPAPPPSRKIRIVEAGPNPSVKLSIKPARNPVSRVILLQNLVRPFTIKQLKDLLQRTGKLTENGFWIDSIKSKCLAMYETEDEAVETRMALHGVKWPTINPKNLFVDFSTEEDIKKKLSEAPLPQLQIQVEEPRRERRRMDGPIREWDLAKLGERSPGEREREKERQRREREEERIRERERALKTHNTKGEKPSKKSSVKSLDDLFNKTKAQPSIYWLSLTAAQIAEKEAQRRKRIDETERLYAEMKAEREKQRIEREKEAEKRRQRRKEREKEREKEKSARRSRSRSRKRSRSRSRSTRRSPRRSPRRSRRSGSRDTRKSHRKSKSDSRSSSRSRS